ncbi:hypothetical protein PL10110_1440001 [Planktothrix agardhii]|nr:hypothetical protein PL10110_1440001 [Planktothrix agardhii]
MLFKEDSMKIHQVQAATNWALLNTPGLFQSRVEKSKEKAIAT